MSVRESWKALFERSFGTSTRLLWVGEKRLAPSGAVQVRELSALPDPSETFDGIGWVTRADVRAGLALLRPRLAPGGSLIVALDESLLLGAVTRAFRLAPKPDVTQLADACEALVLAGFIEPGVVQSLRPRAVLTARKPSVLNALDAFFEQPPA